MRILLLLVLFAVVFGLGIYLGGKGLNSDAQARIQKLEDTQQIADLQSQYSYLIDSKQMEALVELFADDFVWEGGFEQKNGVTSKAELLKLLQGSAESNLMMRHLNTNPYIEVDGDRARGSWYVFGMTTSPGPEGDAAHWVQGKLDQEFIRINGEWKFSRKSTTFNFYSPYEDGWGKTPNARGMP